MKKIWVTGANGQLGSEIRKIHGQFPDASFLFTDIDELDISSSNAVSALVAREKFDFIINCAAYTAVDQAESDREAAFRVNAFAPGILAAAADRHNSLLIHTSTDYVFDGRGCRPYTEEDDTNPAGVYATSKRDGELEIQRAASRSVIIRTSWLYSTFGHNFVKTILRLGRERGELNIVSDQVGSPTYAAGLALAILTMLPRLDELEGHDLLHYADEGAATWYDFAWEIVYLSGLACMVVPISTGDYPTTAPRPSYSILNKNKIKTKYGIQTVHWKENLRRCLLLLNS